MDLRAELLNNQSKEDAAKIVAWVGKDKARLKQLVDIFLHDEYRASQCAGWPLGDVGKIYPELFEPYIPEMLKRMNEPGVHGSVKRNVVRILQYVDVPEKHQGIVMNACFELLADPKEAIAVRVFSMTVLDNLSKVYPDIRQELLAIIKDELEHEPSAAFRSRAEKVLRSKK
jgi:hypothetical protein